jgi:hypothetical protein
MIIVLRSIKLPRKKNFKNQKIHFFPKNLEIQKIWFLQKAQLCHTVCPEKKILNKKQSCGLWPWNKINSPKSTQKKPKKTSRCGMAQILFSWKINYAMPGILEFFALQNETKMRKIGDHDVFSRSFNNWRLKTTHNIK